MSMKFKLEIEIGGSVGLLSGEAVAIALRNQADYIGSRYSLGLLMQEAPANGPHNVIDANGHVIGTWRVIA